jgi:hypothetical protein
LGTITDPPVFLLGSFYDLQAISLSSCIASAAERRP